MWILFESVFDRKAILLSYFALTSLTLVSVASGRYRLRSTGSAAYVLPRTRTKFGERGFFYSSPAAWNTLLSDLHDITDTSTFRKRLKNVLFDRAYNWLLLALMDESYSGALQISRWLIDWLPSVASDHTSAVNSRTVVGRVTYLLFHILENDSITDHIVLIVPSSHINIQYIIKYSRRDNIADSAHLWADSL